MGAFRAAILGMNLRGRFQAKPGIVNACFHDIRSDTSGIEVCIICSCCIAKSYVTSDSFNA